MGKPTKKNGVARILLVDDEVEMLNSYERILTRAGHECAAIADPRELARSLQTFEPDLVITDLKLPHGSGMDVLEEVREFDNRIPVILVTAYGSVETAVAAMKKKAADYLSKPFSMNELMMKVQEALSSRIIEAKESRPPKTGASAKDWDRDIVGVSQAMQSILQLTRKVARTDVNILVTGESGTGKEVIARAIHRLSMRNREIFVPIDCASLPENLLESELFGYNKGAFTGAVTDKIGLFEFADKGTLFLDEISEMTPNLQVKLLRVLQERQFRRLGGREQTKVDVRVIAATNRNLAEAVEDKSFRGDLFYRLNVISIHLPPLRDRMGDIPLLAEYFLRRFGQDNKIQFGEIPPSVMEALKAYHWPGNVRELQNTIERIAALSSGHEISLDDLPDSIPRPAPEGEAAEAGTGRDLFSFRNDIAGDKELDYLVSLLVEHRFNISKAAETAGCSRRTLYRMIHRHGINIETIKAQRVNSRFASGLDKKEDV